MFKPLCSFESSFAIIMISFALGCDAFAVGTALGTINPDRRATFRLWFHFGFFQFLMPVIGYHTGSFFLVFVASAGNLLAALLLLWIATKMLMGSIKPCEQNAERFRTDPTRGWSLITLSFATSMDALGVGFSMGLAKSTLLLPALCIGLTAGLMTFTGITLGRKLSASFGKRIETFGAIILYVIAIHLLVSAKI